MKSVFIYLLSLMSAGGAFGATVDVHISGFNFSPQHVTINQGDSVRWINDDIIIHTATSGTGFLPDGVFNSGNLSHSGTFTKMFNTAGTFFYYCGIHTTMMAHGNDYSVIVQAPNSSLSGNIDLDSYVASPNGLTATLEFRTPSTTTVVHSYSITLNASSNYSVASVAAGTWDVAVKFSHWLRNKVSSKVIAAGANTVDIFLLNGDGDMDNSVTISDLNSLFINFTTADPDNDLDGSGQVDLPDLNVVFINFGQSGVA